MENSTKGVIAGITFFIMLRYDASLIAAFFTAVITLAALVAGMWLMDKAENDQNTFEKWYLAVTVIILIIFAVRYFLK